MTAAPSRRSRPPTFPARREGAARSSTGRAQSALAHAVRLDPADQPVARPPAKHLRVAPKVSHRVLRQRRRARWAVAGVAALSAASMFLLVTFHVFAVQSSFQLDKLERQRTDALRENELLRNLVANRSSATTIFEAATARGFVRPANVIQINVGPAGAGTPSPAPTPVTMPSTDYPAVAAGP
jgi:hypothetical protein